MPHLGSSANSIDAYPLKVKNGSTESLPIYGANGIESKPQILQKMPWHDPRKYCLYRRVGIRNSKYFQDKLLFK